jgi:hypothetical protein
MFEQTSRLAEMAATSVSRRSFFGSVGRWAGVTAAALAGLLTTARSARADTFPSCKCYMTRPPFTYLGCISMGNCYNLGATCKAGC